jgi:hypothetical protein
LQEGIAINHSYNLIIFLQICHPYLIIINTVRISVHVTPTVFVNGIEASDISSSWTLEQWENFLNPLLA